LYGERVLA